MRKIELHGNVPYEYEFLLEKIVKTLENAGFEITYNLSSLSRDNMIEISEEYNKLLMELII